MERLDEMEPTALTVREIEAAAVGGEAPAVKSVNTIIGGAVDANASDIHIEPDAGRTRVRYRIDGVLREAMHFPAAAHPAVISRIKIMADMDIAEKRRPQDGRIRVSVGRRAVDLRVSSLPGIFGEKIVVRILDENNRIVELSQLGLGPQALKTLNHLLARPYGMLLVTGPTGSGKTTTLYASLNKINTVDKNIVTIEDPVEYVLEGITQVNINPKAGLTFAAGLRSILRQDPDIVMVGEIRDNETAEIAVRAANTGHLVFSTLHTNDAASTISRLLEMGVESFLIASSVSGVISQRLVRRLCTRCRKQFEVPPGSYEREFLRVPAGQRLVLYQPAGCEECDFTGYRGRVAVCEVLAVSQAVRREIVKRSSADDIKAVAVGEGMVELRKDAAAKVLAGITSADEIIRAT